MTPEELYKKEFGDADSIPKESVIRLLQNFAAALKIERQQVKNLNIPAVVGRSEQLICHHCGKYKRMQGNGIMHQLCECGE